MKFNAFIKREYDYAIRICSYLAGNPGAASIPVPEISRKLFITQPFVNKIVHQLKKSGIIRTVQGKKGGIYLARNPASISLLDVLEAMGFNSTLNECLRRPEICPLVGTCHIHEFFLEQEKRLLGALREKTVADFAFNDDSLQPIVGVHQK